MGLRLVGCAGDSDPNDVRRVMKLKLRQPLSFVHGCGIDENHVLLFGRRGRKNRKIQEAWHRLYDCSKLTIQTGGVLALLRFTTPSSSTRSLLDASIAGLFGKLFSSLLAVVDLEWSRYSQSQAFHRGQGTKRLYEC